MPPEVHALRSLALPYPVCGVQHPTHATPHLALVTCPRCLQSLQPLADSRYADDGIPEGTFMGQVRDAAHGAGFLFYHTWSAKHSAPGWFDVALARPGAPLFLAELKTARGKRSHDQDAWFHAVSQATGVQAHLWRPRDLGTILHLLKQG